MRENKNTVFLIGNGFNYIVKQLLENKKNGANDAEIDKINRGIDKIIHLWNDFDIIFKDIKRNLNLSNDEDVLKVLHSSLDFLSNFEELLTKEEKDVIQSCKNKINNQVYKRINEIVIKFINMENKKFYNNKNLGKFLNIGNVVQKWLCHKYQINDEITFYTTNYDGILDTVLCDQTKRNGLLIDGFRKDLVGTTLLKIDKPLLENSKNILLHLHGSYKFFSSSLNSCFKFKKEHKDYTGISEFYNTNPVIVFNNPNYKLQQINSYDALSFYWELFLEKLRTATNFVIIGNSLNYEPHILEALKLHFNNSKKKIVIFDKKPDDVEKKLINISCEVVKIKTDVVFTEIDLMKLIIKNI